jgi:threonine/homoserine/homoserine lactone efflux protein
MFGIENYALFLLTALLLNLTPGQDTIFIVGRSLADGVRAGAAAAVGIAVGSVGHTLAVAFGLSALIALSPATFVAIKLVGAAYLIVLGLRALFAPPNRRGSLEVVPTRTVLVASFRQGVITNLQNPKVALFFLALLPQFVSHSSTTKTLAMLTLGATFVTSGLLWCLVLALGAARFRAVLLGRPIYEIVMRRLVGVVFIALGLRLASLRGVSG